MDAIMEIVNRAVGELLGRSSGPLHFRLIIQPIIAAIIAIRAGIRDAKTGQSPFLWTYLTSPAERQRLVQSGWKDIGKVFMIALVLDTVYQLAVLHGFYIVQALMVAVAVAVLPYILLRGLVTRVTRGRRREP